MKKLFEYKRIDINDLCELGEKINVDRPENLLDDGLFALGHQGWELCSITGEGENREFFFKRTIK